MAERNSWAISDVGGVITVEDGRLALGAHLFPGATNPRARSGFRPGPTDPGLVLASGTPDGFVHVNPFQLFVQSTRGTEPGTYVATLDAIKDINVLSTPADPTNPRNDLIIAQQSDKFYADAANTFLVKQVVGTPSGVPVDPTVTGSPDFIRLARVRVNANATTITQANITDLRTTGGFGTGINLAGLYSVAVGGLLPVASSTQRDAIVGKYNGLAAWRQDTKSEEVWDGTVWRPPIVKSLINVANMWVLGPTGVTGSTSATYIDVVGTSISWTKLYDSATTDVVVMLQISGFTASTIPNIKYGIKIGATDYDMIRARYNTANQHQSWSGFRALTGIAAGAYTPIVRAMVEGGTGTIEVSGDDTVSFIIGELPK